MTKSSKKLSTDPYKGVRDFYPEDFAIQKWMFARMRDIVERYGYVEYDASLLEPSELYRAKTGDEIVNEQTYSFTDRGGREVTLRPEMTPTVARMVARRERELSFPLRWYSIPNVFRYERPQRGRLREHWQLNVDLFGVAGIDAEIEIITIARDIMYALGASENDFAIRINHRGLLNSLFADFLGIAGETAHALTKLIDKKTKMPPEEFNHGLKEILGEKADMVQNCCSARTLDDLLSHLPKEFHDSENVADLHNLFAALVESGITNAVFDPSLVRGFDYYTGIVFEVFDIDPKNSRSLFGGGRYDGLTEIFGAPNIPVVGFGMGDVTARDFLESRNTLPHYRNTAHVSLCTTDNEHIAHARALAEKLRNAGIHVAIDLSGKRIGDQISAASKHHIPYVICIGPEEVQQDRYTVKELDTGKETELSEDAIASFLHEQLA